jgi:hypothetical protein
VFDGLRENSIGLLEAAEYLGTKPKHVYAVQERLLAS